MTDTAQTFHELNKIPGNVGAASKAREQGEGKVLSLFPPPQQCIKRAWVLGAPEGEGGWSSEKLMTAAPPAPPPKPGGSAPLPAAELVHRG